MQDKHCFVLYKIVQLSFKRTNGFNAKTHDCDRCGLGVVRVYKRRLSSARASDGSRQQRIKAYFFKSYSARVVVYIIILATPRMNGRSILAYKVMYLTPKRDITVIYVGMGDQAKRASSKSNTRMQPLLAVTVLMVQCCFFIRIWSN